MPFTLSHPAAAVPLRGLLGRFGLLSALVIGSMTPDVGYFVPGLGISAAFTHSVIGVFGHGLPVGLLLYVLFHGLMKAPCVDLMPAWWRARLAPLARPGTWLAPGASPWGVPVSLLVGAATHVAWDAFTHAGTPPVQALPVLSTVLFEVGGRSILLFKFLQYLSGVLGLALLAVWVWRWASSAELAGESGSEGLSWGARAGWAALLLVLPPLMALRGTSIAIREAGLPTLERVVVHFVVLDIQALGGLLLLYSLAWQALMAVRRRRLS